MNRCRTLSLGAVGGGLLAAAFLPMSVAVADEPIGSDNGAVASSVTDASGDSAASASIDLDNLSIDFNEGGTGYTLSPSGDNMVNISHAGDIDGGAGDDGSASVHVIEHTWNIGDISNVEFIIDSTGAQGDAAGVPADGSVFLHSELGSGFSNDYIDLVGDGGSPDTITDVLTTPFGSYEIPTDALNAIASNGTDVFSDFDLSNLGFSDLDFSDLGISDIDLSAIGLPDVTLGDLLGI
jgi:hypothetical protein